jgi:hypothetical protein
MFFKPSIYFEVFHVSHFPADVCEPNTKIIARVISRSQQRDAGGNWFLGRFYFADKNQNTRNKIRSCARSSKRSYFFAVFTRSLSIAESGKIGRGRSEPRDRIAPKAETNRILWVLETRMEGQLLQEKTKDKLSTLSPEQIQLLESLAVRIIKSGHTPASDIAFLLITALIISS